MAAMSLNIVDQGVNNTIAYAKGDTRLHGKITVRGSGNRIAIGPGAGAYNLQLNLGSNCKVLIADHCTLGALFIHAAEKAEIVIGRETGVTGLVRLLLHEAGRIQIGAGCLLASDIDITVSDMHSIVDVESGKRLNPARDIVIEDRVWIGQRAMILKGSHIEAGSIVGAGSIVTGHVPANSMAVGVPAKVIKSSVTWDHRLL